MSVTSTPQTSPARPASESKLQRRREELHRSRDRVSSAETAVRDVEARLRELEVTGQQAQRRLKAAEQEVVEAKKLLKRTAKERDQVQQQRRKARKRSGGLAEAVRAAEDKYDKAVLADLVRREKERDLAVHAAAPAGPDTPGFTVVDNRETQRTGQIADPDPEAVPADPAPAKVSGRTNGRAGARSRSVAAGTASGGSTARTTRSGGSS